MKKNAVIFVMMTLLPALGWGQMVMKNSMQQDVLEVQENGDTFIKPFSTGAANDTALVLVDANGKLLRTLKLADLRPLCFFEPERRFIATYNYATPDSYKVVALTGVPLGASHAILRAEMDLTLATPDIHQNADYGAKVQLFAGPPLAQNALEIPDYQVLSVLANQLTRSISVTGWYQCFPDPQHIDPWRYYYTEPFLDNYGQKRDQNGAICVVPIQAVVGDPSQGQFAVSTKLLSSKSLVNSLTTSLWLEGYYIRASQVWQNL